MPVIIITARWQSTRLPGKMLADINGRPMLQVVIDRCLQSCVKKVVVATTESSQPIIDYCEKNKITYVVSDEEDIVHRLYVAASSVAETDYVVRVWGDAPLTNPRTIDRIVKHWEKTKAEYIWASREPLGTSAALVDIKRLEKDKHLLFGNRLSSLWYHKYCIQQPYAVSLASPIDLSYVNLSVDDERSLEIARAIIG